jgi:tetratricopeptide (TPR) repeat protein
MGYRSIRLNSRRRALRLVLAAAVAGTLWPAGRPLRAGESNETARKARELYQRGEEAFKAERFDEAFRHWQEGYQLSERPLFLLNMAQAQRRRGDLRSARSLYRRYLLVEPETKLRGDVEAILKEIDSSLADEDKASKPPEPPAAEAPPAFEPPPAAPPAPSPPPPPPEPAPSPTTLITTVPDQPARPIYKRWWFWTAAGAAVAAGVAGALFLHRDPYVKSGSLGIIETGR